MSLTINTVISRMKKRVAKPIFDAVEKDFWLDILFEESLPAISSFYPTVVKGILVTENMAIEAIDISGRKNRSSHYAIPMIDEMYPYTGISTFHYPRNYLGGGVYAHNGIVDAVTSKIITSTNMVDVRYTASFEAPNILILNPPPRMHMDFAVSMYRLKKIEEINTGYHEMFKDLYEADCKIALYHKFFTIAEGGSYGGIELKDYVSNFLDYESRRTEILETMENDYYKDPSRYEEAFNYSAFY